MSSRIDEIKERHYAIRLTDGREICFQCVDDLRPGLVADWPCDTAHLLAELARVTSERACHCGRPVSVAPRDLCGACIEFDTDIKCYVGRAAPEGKG